MATGPSRPQLSSDERPAGMPGPEVVQAEAPAAAPQATPPDTSTKKMAPARGKTRVTAGATSGTRSGKPPIQDPMARAALAFVGSDPDAAWYWYQAINDPALPPQERQDLIEDLNEDGLADPHHPTAEELPLILNRLQLIEEVIWNAMDEVNTDAFLEAYKDLVNLAFQAMGNG